MAAKKKPRKIRDAVQRDPRFVRVVEAFAADRNVNLGGQKGVGSGALQVNGRLFAMMSSKAEFVLKLPMARVDELIASGKGRRFDPGHGRLMKEWLVVPKKGADWVELAKESCEFVRRTITVN